MLKDKAEREKKQKSNPSKEKKNTKR